MKPFSNSVHFLGWSESEFKVFLPQPDLTEGFEQTELLCCSFKRKNIEEEGEELLGESSAQIHRPIFLSCCLLSVYAAVHAGRADQSTSCVTQRAMSRAIPPLAASSTWHSECRTAGRGSVRGRWRGHAIPPHVCLHCSSHTNTQTCYINLTLNLLERNSQEEKTHAEVLSWLSASHTDPHTHTHTHTHRVFCVLSFSNTSVRLL